MPTYLFALTRAAANLPRCIPYSRLCRPTKWQTTWPNYSQSPGNYALDDSWLSSHAAPKLPCGVFANTTTATTATTATTTTTTTVATLTTTNCVTNYAHIFASFSLWLCKNSAGGQSNSSGSGARCYAGLGKGHGLVLSLGLGLGLGEATMSRHCRLGNAFDAFR